ncbi:BREX-1 system adenine-specific DNA-methyltransferase PglX [Clostridium estertheticum]|uniref:BREX-1 system adenine-specific DNA-methyltransferase PglX n=1 Tax=Clostridium estertheticum TaxID=238834 RepID=UPI001C0AA26A|nr:BREX-1 system adenine-specific DNA-methyltransferase PglX [Clostridium estertheticum]MBU3173717.1 BREX-1 system adenine-specific DNA-methyltransferase PglX [Clostridium estertheticum]
MNKTAIKNFAIWARNKLIAEITYKAGLLGITEKEIKSPLPQSTQTVKFFDIGTKEPYSITGVEIEQRKKLADEIQRKASQSDHKTAYQSVFEEVAYTWFNRLIAVRFMEVNDYLPARIRVLSSESSNKSEPDLVTNPMDADLDYTPYEKDRIMQLKNDNQLDELFRMLFIKQCNALNAILPELFEKTNDYTEVLMNVSFTDQDGAVYHLVNDIPEDDFNVGNEGQIEIIGWLYQAYITEVNDMVYNGSMSKSKVSKELLPAATQLFTPDWPIRYMVENSLGRLWIEGHSNDSLKSNWKYYLDEVHQEVEVEVKLEKIREESKSLIPKDIKFIDPCMGSGHILVYAFEVLMQIYESYGYNQRDAAISIVENNIYGLDIDNRAFQLAYFAVMMKARQYNRRILNGETKCKIYAIQESNAINRAQLKYFGYGMSDFEHNNALSQIENLLDTMCDAKEYGSILIIENLNWLLLTSFVENYDNSGQMTIDTIGLDDTQKRLIQLVRIAEVMAQKYDVVVTNPPYLSSARFSPKLSNYVSNKYAEVKSDLSMVMFKRVLDGFVAKNGFVSFITTSSWMFLKSFETIRAEVINNYQIESILDFGTELFDGKVGHNPIVAWVNRNTRPMTRKITVAIRLIEYCYSRRDEKQKEFFNLDNRHFPIAAYFSKIPGSPIAYWASEKIIKSFDYSKLGEISNPRQGLATGKNDRFIRLWYEVSRDNLNLGAISRKEAQDSRLKWFPYNKGGEFKKWYGNNDYVVNWEFDGIEIRNFKDTNGKLRSRPQNMDFYFKPSVTWSKISSGSISFRYKPAGHIFDVAGTSIFVSNDLIKYLQGFCNSCVALKIANILSPTLNYEVGHIASFPIALSDNEKDKIDKIVSDNISLSKMNWDSFEASWDFIKHPLVIYKSGTGYADVPMNIWHYKIEDAFKNWSENAEAQFNILKTNEEELNRIFIDIYGLQDELTSDVEDKYVTIRKADLGRDVRSFISYAVGCMLGRYSIDLDGLAYAGGGWDDSKYSAFIPDKDNILPITDEEYFEDDVVGLFCTFLKKTFGTETLEENLDFIAKALINKGNSSREIIRNYFLKDFFKDHCKIYKKRPIYWLFDSGKADGFKALVYMHRYNEDTIGNLRIEYLHRIQRIYENEILRMQEIIENSKDDREMTAATKGKEKLVKQLKETKEYDEKIAHLALARIVIDLDDGVKVNYEKVQTDTDGKKLNVLAKI